jgi:hypothetical protein
MPGIWDMSGKSILSFRMNVALPSSVPMGKRSNPTLLALLLPGPIVGHEDGGGKFLFKYLPDYAASHPRK